MPRYRLKPREADAIRFDGSNADDLVAWAASLGGCVTRGVAIHRGAACDCVIVVTLAGKMAVPLGWWVVRDGDGDLDVVSPEAFGEDYEPLDRP